MQWRSDPPHGRRSGLMRISGRDATTICRLSSWSSGMVAIQTRRSACCSPATSRQSPRHGLPRCMRGVRSISPAMSSSCHIMEAGAKPSSDISPQRGHRSSSSRPQGAGSPRIDLRRIFRQAQSVSSRAGMARSASTGRPAGRFLRASSTRWRQAGGDPWRARGQPGATADCAHCTGCGPS